MSTADMTRFTLNRVNRDYPVTSGHEIDIWHQNSQRILHYGRLWSFYKGNHWNYTPEAGEPVTTANFVKMFIDKHATYLFGNQFTIHGNWHGYSNDKAAELLMAEWEKNDIGATGFQMGQVGGVTGDCWVNVGIDRDPIYGDRVKLTVFPSEFVFPIYFRNSDREYTGLLLQWPESEVVSNAFGRVRVRTYVAGQYWTKDDAWELRDGQPIAGAKRNLLGEIPFVHIPNVTCGTEVWGMSDIGQIIDINREINEKLTDMSDIINYHAAPVTIIYGAKASTLQKGARKVWSGLPKDAKVENLALPGGSLESLVAHIDNLKDTLFQLGHMPKVAFGGLDAVSNTTGVALAIQFAPILEHMRLKRLTYTKGIQYLNYLILKCKEILGEYKANGAPLPYYTGVKWPDPLPRDKDLRLNELNMMQQMKLLSRAQILKELIHNDMAPADLEEGDIPQVLREADEEMQAQAEMLAEAQAAGMPPPAPPGQSQAGAAEGNSQQSEQAVSFSGGQ